jgi:hypothetical protein
MLCSCQDAGVRTADVGRKSGAYEQARKVSNPRPSVLETAAPPLARAQVNTRMTGCASTMRMRSKRRSVSYQRTSVLPVFPASRPAACRSSSDRPGRHGYAPTLNGAVPRSFVSTMCMRAMDIDSRHSVDDVNRLSADDEHPVALVTRPTPAQRPSLSVRRGQGHRSGRTVRTAGDVIAARADPAARRLPAPMIALLQEIRNAQLSQERSNLPANRCPGASFTQGSPAVLPR